MLRYDTQKVLIAGIGRFVSVDRRPNMDSTFPVDLVQYLWTIGWLAGPDLDSLRTAPAGVAALQ